MEREEQRGVTLAEVARRTKVHKTTVIRRIRRFEAESGVLVFGRCSTHRQRFLIDEEFVLKIAS